MLLARGTRSGITKSLSALPSRSILKSASVQQITCGYTSQTNSNNKEEETQKPKGSLVGAITACSILAIGGALLYYTDLGKPIAEKFNERANTLRDDVYESYGIEKDLPFLPPPLPDASKYTIVIDLDAIATTKFSNGKSTISKRAGLDYFLYFLSQQYDIILFTKELPPGNPAIVYKLDPTGSIFKYTKTGDSGVKLINTQYTNRVELFMRDPAKIILIDSTPPEKTYPHTNALCIGKPVVNQADGILVDLTRVLYSLAITETPDVRNLVRNLQSPDIGKKIHELAEFINIAPEQLLKDKTQQVNEMLELDPLEIQRRGQQMYDKAKK